METTALLVALRRESALLAAAARIDLTAAVPNCPGWTVAELVRHTGQAHRWGLTNVMAGIPEGQTKGDDIVFPPDAELPEWIETGAAEMATRIAADPDRPCWSFAPHQRSAAFWARRAAQETLVHRWDAETAVGLVPNPLDGETALDGIDEFFGVFVPLVMRRSAKTVPAGSLHLHRTDGDGEWMLQPGPDGTLSVTREHGKGDAAVRGSASDLLLLLWGRLEPDAPALELFGDRSIVEAWRVMAP